MYGTDTREAEPLAYDASPPPKHGDAQPVAHARGFGQAFGLHPIPAVMTLTINTMLFTGTVFTLGALVPVAIGVAAVLGFITYRCQQRMYGDNHDAALVKALSVGVITAIPVGLPMFLTVPSAVVGVIHTLRGK